MPTKKQNTFRTMTDPKITIETNPGSRIEKEVALRILDDGTEDFYIKSETNLYAKIQAHRDDCDLEKLLITCTETGDISLLNKREPVFMDITEMPENFFEAYKKIKEEEEKFNDLPAEIKEKFNNNFSEYLATAGSEEWMRKTGLLKEIEPEETEGTETEGEEVNE